MNTVYESIFLNGSNKVVYNNELYWFFNKKTVVDYPSEFGKLLHHFKAS